MKKAITYLAASLLVGTTALSSGCSSFLEVDSPSYINPEEFYTNKTEVELALSGIYGRLAKDDTYGQTLSVLFDARADEGYYNRRSNENWTVALYRHTASDVDIEDCWAMLYDGVNLANTFLEHFKAENFTEAEANAYIGEARFLRALFYMNLTYLWNEVPIRKTSSKDQSDNNLAPSSLEDVYQFIADDLKYAAQWLPHAKSENYVPGRANSMAAHALLARLYLKKAGYPLQDASGYQEALDELEIILKDGWHTLKEVSGEITTTNNGYRSLFLTYIQDEYYPQESMFEISFSYLRSSGIVTDGRIGAVNGLYFDFVGGPMAYAMENVSPLLYNKYESEDMRRDWNIPGYSYTANGDLQSQNGMGQYYCPGKYRRWEAADLNDLNITGTLASPDGYTVLEKANGFSQNFTSVNFPVIRFADVLLMYAEALNEVKNGPTQEAIEALNRVRRRAGLADANATVTADKVSFFNEIVDERMRELCFEGIRFHDLVRWGLLGERLEMMKNSIVNHPNYKETSDQHNSYLRSWRNFDPRRHLSLPYPAVEVTANELLDQKPEWLSAE